MTTRALHNAGAVRERHGRTVDPHVFIRSLSHVFVNKNLVTRFYNDIQIPEARAFNTSQMAIESIHSECYSLLIDTYIKDAKKQERLFNSIKCIDFD